MAEKAKRVSSLGSETSKHYRRKRLSMIEVISVSIKMEYIFLSQVAARDSYNKRECFGQVFRTQMLLILMTVVIIYDGKFLACLGVCNLLHWFCFQN